MEIIHADIDSAIQVTLIRHCSIGLAGFLEKIFHLCYKVLVSVGPIQMGKLFLPSLSSSSLTFFLLKAGFLLDSGYTHSPFTFKHRLHVGFTRSHFSFRDRQVTHASGSEPLAAEPGSSGCTPSSVSMMNGEIAFRVFGGGG